MYFLERVVQHPVYQRALRFILVVTGLTFLALTLVFLSRSPLARSLWPWDYTTLADLSFIFLASITAAIAAPVIWIGLCGELAAAVGGAINLLVTFAASGIFMLQSYGLRANPRLINGAIICAIFCIVTVLIYLATRRLDYQDSRPMPHPVYGSFVFFVAVLMLAGILLVLKQPVFPWRLSGEASIIYGWIFLGAASYFAYSVYRPRFGRVEPEYRLSLVIYTGVVIYSGALAVYYLFLKPATHLRWTAR